MPSYSPAPTDAVVLVENRINSGHYPDLVEAQVTINTVFAYAPGGKPAVKLHGYPCAATIKINSELDRLEGKADLTLTIDGRAWADEWTDAEKVALIDHEIEHISVQRSKPTDDNPQPEILSDDLGRPKVKLKLHDIVMGGFSAIAKRHGDASFERKIAKTIRDEFGQLLWAWDDDSAPAGPMPRLAIG